MSRRTSVRPETAPVLTGPLWRSACAAERLRRRSGDPPALPGAPDPRPYGSRDTSPYGDLEAPDRNGIALAHGFTSRVVGRSGSRVGGVTWHDAPGGGACFPDGDGWIYVSNSEVPLLGGVSAIRFGPDGTIRSGYRILSGTDRNSAGGATPWDTWLSCEETSRGRIFECDPYGERAAVPRLAMGLFRHGGAAFDPARTAVYLTEGEPDGCFYRFRPEEWGDLTTGVLEVMAGGPGPGPVTWLRVPHPAAAHEPTRDQVEGARRFDGGGGCHYSGGFCYFTTAGDGRVWAYDAENEWITVLYAAPPPPPERGLRPDDGHGGADDSLGQGSPGGARAGLGHDAEAAMAGLAGGLFAADRDGDAEMTILTEDGTPAPFLRVVGLGGAGITGPAFSPDGGRLYFSSRRDAEGEPTAGVTYEITGPFRG
ncbi:alkaline phosphatase PhoX [Microtetraspora niveoalba]|uniref:alkaline phosphatase PhoX n=1 Tax=Microtetraspora niveoalba TaxID=46175 RepID=UPI0008331F0E|nr:alkaline phosphatase PhoX [Microtetraspora niveoalba]